ncbi:hypothetical protein [Acetobacter aceti]|uniref:hypothetical protein n=1 Tax=Acetobacter aceti TaxID=435 RepID=UPI0011D2C5EE|nr:hypothetical protein [Acetobacter aceti]
MRLRLGKTPARHDAAAPKTASLRMMRRRAAERLVRSVDPSPLLLANDRLGNCTAAALVNGARAQAALGGFQIAVTDDNAIDFYSASTGYIRGDERTDLGGNETDVLAYAARHGYRLDTQCLYPVWGDIDPADLNSVRLSVETCGTAYIGVQFSESDLWVNEAGNLADVW